MLKQFLNYDFLAIHHLHNAFNSQKITGTMKIFLMALQSRTTSTEPHCVSMKKLQKLDEFKKFVILKKGIGIESQNLCKQFNDQKNYRNKMKLNHMVVIARRKVNSKAFAIPILTVCAFII